MKKTLSVSHSTAAAGNRAGILLAFVVLVLAIVAIGGTVMWRRNQTHKVIVNRHAQLEPKTMLERYFVLLSLRHHPDDPDWHELLDFMSRDDRAWLSENLADLASLDPELAGRNPLHMRPEEQTWSAVHALLDFGPHQVRPVVSSIQTRDVYGVAYLHEPNRLETLRPVFLIQEAGYWKLRRFGGERDKERVMRLLVDSKSSSRRPLSAEEQAWQQNPAAFERAIRDALLREAGVEPRPAQY